MVDPEVESLYYRCQVQGRTICGELTSQPWGMREFAIQDIDGYVLRIGKVEKKNFL